MARTALSVQPIRPAGIVPSLTAANVDGHSFPNRGGQFLWVKNASVSSINVTLVTGETVGDLAVDDDVVAVAAGAQKLIGPFDERTYNQDDGTMNVDFSSVTTVTVGVFSL